MLSSLHWVLLALLAAFLESLKDLCSKSSLRSLSPQMTGLAASAVPIPLLLGILLLSPSPAAVDPAFMAALALSGSLNILGMYQFMRALQASDLSVTIPFIAFTPIFLLATSPLLVGEIPSVPDMLGIICIVAGAYILHLHTIRRGILAPLQAIWQQPGPRRMLSVALIYSLTSNFDKIGVQHSSPLLWSFSITVFMTAGFLFLLRHRTSEFYMRPRGTLLIVLLLIGIFQGLGLVVHTHALLQGPVPSVIALKRTSILFAVIWGVLFLRESHSRERLAGGLTMIIGIGILAIESRP
jgi:uncharacterized membrane protein